MARDGMETERGLDGLDVPAPARREVPQREGDERRRRRRELQAVPEPEDIAAPRGDPEPLGPEGVVKTGPYTVQFRLKSPNNAFPYLVSQTSYQAIIQPAAIAAKPDTWVSSGMIGTGVSPESQNKQRRARPLRRLLGGKAPLDGVRITFYTDPAPMVLTQGRAARPRRADVAATGADVPKQQQVQGLQRPEPRTTCSDASRPRPFRDPRVRRAVALATAPTSSTASSSAPGRSETTRRSGRLSVDGSVDQAAAAEPCARAGTTPGGQENLKSRSRRTTSSTCRTSQPRCRHPAARPASRSTSTS